MVLWLPAGLDSFSVFFQILVQALPTQQRVSLELFLQPLPRLVLSCPPAAAPVEVTSASSDFRFSGATEIHSSQLSDRAFTEEPPGAHGIDCRPETGTWRWSETKAAPEASLRRATLFHSKKAWMEGPCPQLVSAPIPLLDIHIPRECLSPGLGHACAWLGSMVTGCRPTNLDPMGRRPGAAEGKTDISEQQVSTTTSLLIHLSSLTHFSLLALAPLPTS